MLSRKTSDLHRQQAAIARLDRVEVVPCERTETRRWRDDGDCRNATGENLGTSCSSCSWRARCSTAATPPSHTRPARDRVATSPVRSTDRCRRGPTAPSSPRAEAEETAGRATTSVAARAGPEARDGATQTRAIHTFRRSSRESPHTDASCTASGDRAPRPGGVPATVATRERARPPQQPPMRLSSAPRPRKADEPARASSRRRSRTRGACRPAATPTAGTAPLSFYEVAERAPDDRGRASHTPVNAPPDGWPSALRPATPRRSHRPR